MTDVGPRGETRGGSRGAVLVRLRRRVAGGREWWGGGGEWNGGGEGAMRAGDRWFRLALFPQQRDAANRPGRFASGIQVCESGWLLSARGWDPAPLIG